MERAEGGKSKEKRSEGMGKGRDEDIQAVGKKGLGT